MALPITMAPNGNGWMTSSSSRQAPPPPPPPQSQEGDDLGLQARPMGLKVHYTFDKDNQVNCLARWPQVLSIQTVPLDERNSIGIVDLRLCLQAIVQGSPELVCQPEHDFTVYALDFSEPDTPLVGQGMLSWVLESASNGDEQKMVTGRVTKNLLALFGNGVRETLEVKLKLTQVPRPVRTESASNAEPYSAFPKGAATPTDSTEWNSFIQSNPNLGRSHSITGIPSPVMTQIAPADMSHSQVMDARPGSRPVSRPSSVAPGLIPATSFRSTPVGGSLPDKSQTAEEVATAPSPVSAESAPKEAPSKPSRPSSRASRAKGQPPRPRGRPRKQPADGNTSAAEEQPTDADSGAPKKKRAKITKAEYPAKTPLDAAPDSLRVAASTSGSLRTLRPVLPVSEGNPAAASHLQEAPRAPTPVPQALAPARPQKKATARKSRRESLASVEPAAYQSLYQDSQSQLSQRNDARSPTDSLAMSPDNYTPEDSPADLGSSPPVPRSTAYIQSSPMPSSPILPPMPPHDSGFMSGGMDDAFDDDFPQTLPAQPATHDEFPVQAHPAQQIVKPVARKAKERQFEDFSFQAVNPGPPELLPTTSIYNPPYRKAMDARPKDQGAAPQLKRANTEPSSVRPEAKDTASPGPSQEQQPSLPAPEVEAQFPCIGEADMGLPAALLEFTDDRDMDALHSMKELLAATHEEPSQVLEQKEELPQLDITMQQAPPKPRQIVRAASMSAAFPTAPASDPPAPAHNLTLPPPPPPPTAFSEALCPPSDFDMGRSNKNMVKKQTIKDRLEKAVESGEMPPFCQNCGAIETPTWRKMWTQDHTGTPGYFEYSEKPGQVTAIDILERDSEGGPTKYRLVKKALGPTEDKNKWTEMLLCNPCGIWLAKFKSHRPPDRWEKDASRLGQPRRKREPKTGNGNSRAKKARTKSDSQMHPTSEAYLTTDPAWPAEDELLQDMNMAASGPAPQQSESLSHEPHQPFKAGSNREPALTEGSPNQRGPGSTHSRASGTVNSPIPIDDDLGGTRRLLFPSPRKDGVPKVLGEVTANVAKATTEAQDSNNNSNNNNTSGTGKENNTAAAAAAAASNPTDPAMTHDDMQDLFGTPPARPSTPPPKSSGQSGPFKTPTRATPSHRPITRSVSKSIRSAVSLSKSPNQAAAALQRTPTKTPRSISNPNLISSASKRRTPGRHAHFLDAAPFETPFTATINQLLSEANEFTSGSPSHGLGDLDLISLPNLDSDGLAVSAALDFGNYLSTDLAMPSSPPLLGRNSSSAHHVSFGDSMDYDTHSALWSQLSEVMRADDQPVEVSK